MISTNHLDERFRRMISSNETQIDPAFDALTMKIILLRSYWDDLIIETRFNYQDYFYQGRRWIQRWIRRYTKRRIKRWIEDESQGQTMRIVLGPTMNHKKLCAKMLASRWLLSSRWPLREQPVCLSKVLAERCPAGVGQTRWNSNGGFEQAGESVNAMPSVFNEHAEHRSSSSEHAEHWVSSSKNVLAPSI